MPEKTLSLKKKKEFERVFLCGKKIKTKNFSVIYLNNKINKTRIGIIISKKVSKLAVERNKIRRRLRYALTTSLQNNIKTSLDIIVTTFPSIKNNSFIEIKQAINYVVKNI